MAFNVNSNIYVLARKIFAFVGGPAVEKGASESSQSQCRIAAQSCFKAPVNAVARDGPSSTSFGRARKGSNSLRLPDPSPFS